MESILLTNKDDILFYTQTSAAIDEYKLNVHSYNAQVLYLEPILGTDLYEKMLDLVDTGNISASTYSDYNTLLNNYITPSVVFHAMELFIPLNAFQIADAGVSQYTPSNAQFSAIDEIDKLAIKYKIIGNKYDSKLQAYLCKNANLFPEYQNNTGLIDKTESVAKCNWYLGVNNSQSKIRI